MKKIILILIAFIALLAACSKIEIKPEPEPEPPVEYPKITINAKKTDLSLFEKVDAFLGLEGEKEELHGIDFVLTGIFDSIHWEIPNMYFDSRSSSSLLVKEGFAFASPGTYTLYLSAFMNNVVVRRDSVEFHVKNTKDFLGINWKDGKDEEFNSSFKTYSSINNIIIDYLVLKSYITGDKPFARLTPSFIRVPLNRYSELSYNALTNCINTTFGESQFNYTGDVKKSNLIEKYNELFKNPLEENYYPVKIWQTTKNNIVLLAYPVEDPLNPVKTYYHVMAEPRI